MADPTTSTTLIKDLAPAFAVGFAIQHLNELLDPILSAWANNDNNRKKVFMGLTSLLFGGLATWLLQLRVMELINGSPHGGVYGFMDAVVTALVISTGTEGINSIVKFLGYAKDQTKATAAKNEKAAAADLEKVNREP
jgi:hypothetical protein